MLNFPWRLTVMVASLTLPAGCGTVVPSDSAQTFSAGVTAAKTQTHLALESVAQMTRQDSIAYASAQPTLKAANLVSSPDDETIAAWDRLLAVLEKYSQDLTTLTGGNLSQPFSDAVAGLAGQMNETSNNLKNQGLTGSSPQVSAGMATAFTEVAKVLIQARAAAEAKAVALQTDAQIGAILTGLADALGATAGDGLRHTVAAHWRDREGALQVSFLGTTDASARQQITTAFADLLNQEEAEDLALASVRNSLLTLAEAHHALALGQEITLAGAVAAIANELKSAQAQHDQLAAKLAKP